jgi:anti-sigma factor RsiW
MPSGRNPRSADDALLLKLSALLDGELSADDEAEVFDAMSQDPALLAAFESLASMRAGFAEHADLAGDEARALTAAVLAATTPGAIDDTSGATALASRAVDDDLDGAAHAHLCALLDEKPALAAPVAGFVASVDAVKAAARAVSSIESVASALRTVPDHVDAVVAARERAFVLASADLDAALTPTEAAELSAALPGLAEEIAPFASFGYAAEALRVASSSASFASAAAKAGAAALHVIDAEQAIARAQSSAPAAPSVEERAPLLARLWRAFAPARAPLAFGVAAAAVFFVVSGPAPQQPPAPDRMAARDAIVNALAPSVLADAAPAKPPAGDLPLLADNTADVEALDATSSTMVFSTEQSNITVIWVDTGT